MEIVLGVLLLFGAFTLGTVSADHAAHETHAVPSASVASDSAGQTVDSDDLQPCPKSGSVLPYRDLTRPVVQPAAQPPVPAKATDDEAEFPWDE